MATLKDIKRKMRGVKSTQQITRAMKMMATVKLRRALEALSATKLYLEKLEQMVVDLRAVLPSTVSHPLFGNRKVKATGVILVTGERGLCGAFNHDLVKFSNNLLKQHPDREKKLILIGKKGIDYYRRQTYTIIGSHPDMVGKFSQKALALAAKNAVSLYNNQIIDELVIVYTHFISTLDRRIVMRTLLPLSEIGAGKESRQSGGQTIQFDPSPDIILNALIPRYVEGLFMKAVLESSTAEQAARMVAMDAATDRADEIIDDLTLKYNRTRQAVITKELSEVIAGADALSE
ncbi:ATP synthase F1 subunit gamma [bacterium CG2_30_54_10]|nr:MAG: ATP synthase F1 subunit gamma [bacterium CG2_30_54_10]